MSKIIASLRVIIWSIQLSVAPVLESIWAAQPIVKRDRCSPLKQLSSELDWRSGLSAQDHFAQLAVQRWRAYCHWWAHGQVWQVSVHSSADTVEIKKHLNVCCHRLKDDFWWWSTASAQLGWPRLDKTTPHQTLAQWRLTRIPSHCHATAQKALRLHPFR